MRFEAVVKKEKMSEYFDVRSPFEKLLERTCEQLQKEYGDHYSRNRTFPTAYRDSVCQMRFAISDVPKEAFPKLMRIFSEYVGPTSPMFFQGFLP